MSALAFALRGLRRQPGRALLGVAGIAATGALLFDMLMLSRGLVVSMERLLESTGFDVRVTATTALPPAGPRIADATALASSSAELAAVDEAVAMRIEEGELSVGGVNVRATLIGANVSRRRPWTLFTGRDLVSGLTEPTAESARPHLPLIVNRVLWEELRLAPGASLTVRGACAAGASAPPVVFTVTGAADFPFDEVSERTAVTTLSALERTCGDRPTGAADMVMVASRPDRGAEHAAQAVRRLRPDVEVVTNEQLVARFQQVEFSYFRQISAVLASITLFFGLLLITVLLSVSTNQRLGEIAALRALGFSRRRMSADVLWRASLLVGAGGALALPLGVGFSVWLDRLLKTMPGIPANVHFFVFEMRTLAIYLALLAITTAASALYPVLIVGTLPIARTLRNEVVG